MTYEDLLQSMKERYRGLAGFEADAASDIGIRLKVLAAEAASLYGAIGALKAQIFPQTGTGEFLDLHAETKGLSRKPALAAKGALVFSRETPASSDIAIPAGVVCATKPEPQVLVETTEQAVLLAGETSVRVPAAAQTGGETGNIAAGAVRVMISPAAGITKVANESAFTGGLDEETDDALRERLLLSFRNISNGTNSAFYYDLAMSREGVSSANILPRRRGRGTVDVVVACKGPEPHDEIVAGIMEDMAEKKEINVDVLVIEAATDRPPVTVEIAPKSGCDYGLAAQSARDAVFEYLNGLGVGEPLFLSALGARLLSCDGVYNYRILLPESDRVTLKDHVLRPGEITVNRMAVG